jgi:large subunit ribosomal protein L10
MSVVATAFCFLKRQKALYTMAKTRQQKEAAYTSILSELKSAKGVVFFNFQGLNISASDALRDACRSAGVRYISTKKTLLQKACAEAGITLDTKSFGGSVAALFSSADELSAAKIIGEFQKKNEAAAVFGGVLEGAFLPSAQVIALSKIPSKQQLLGQLVGTLNAPVSGFVNVLAGNIRGLVTVLGAIKDQKTA